MRWSIAGWVLRGSGRGEPLEKNAEDWAEPSIETNGTNEGDDTAADIRSTELTIGDP